MANSVAASEAQRLRRVAAYPQYVLKSVGHRPQAPWRYGGRRMMRAAMEGNTQALDIVLHGRAALEALPKAAE